MSGESEFIDWVRRQQSASPFVLLPSGDDLAALHWPNNELLLIGADQVLDGVHFDSAIHAPRFIGRKAMNRNLSDCAAMACLPAAAVATVALPRGTQLEYVQELYRGLREAADPFDCPIVGGDTGSWDGKLVVTVTILGRAAGIKPISRAGARAGDAIYVSGRLGGSILGRHLTSPPRIHLARELAATGHITAMIDLSDGLSRDLRHICEQSGAGAIVDAAAVPIHDDAGELNRRDARPPLHHALHDGEDYELLFAWRSDAANNPPKDSATRIGTITADPAIWLNHGDKREPLQALGWEHKL